MVGKAIFGTFIFSHQKRMFVVREPIRHEPVKIRANVWIGYPTTQEPPVFIANEKGFHKNKFKNNSLWLREIKPQTNVRNNLWLRRKIND
jgi:hypothetical protein